MEDKLYDPSLQQDETHPYSRLFAVESAFMASEGYFRNPRTDIFRQYAMSLIEETSKCENFHAFVPYLALNYFDRFISRYELPNVITSNNEDNVKLLVICCLTIAWKMRTESFNPDPFLMEKKLQFDRFSVEKMELQIRYSLLWRMLSLTPISFAEYFIGLWRLPAQPLNRQHVYQIIIRSQADIKLTQFKPSVIATSAVLIVASKQFPVQFDEFEYSVLSCKFVKTEEVKRCMAAISLLAEPPGEKPSSLSQAARFPGAKANEEQISHQEGKQPLAEIQETQTAASVNLFMNFELHWTNPQEPKVTIGSILQALSDSGPPPSFWFGGPGGQADEEVQILPGGPADKEQILRRPGKEPVEEIQEVQWATTTAELYMNLRSGSPRYLDEFEQLQKLGKGGYGHVFKCKSKKDHMDYAVKLIPLEDEVNDREKTLREIRALSSLHHDHVVKFYKAWIEDGFDVEDSSDSESETNVPASSTLYIQMEYCPSTLAQKMEDESGMDHPTVWCFFRQIVEGLYHIHEKRIIHRDIAKFNIFLDSTDNIKIGDFGLARSFTVDQSSGHSVVGSGGKVGHDLYRAPEMDTEFPVIDEKVDIFSVGVLLFEMLHHFGTNSERYIVLTNLRKGVFPDKWLSENSLLLDLLALSPEHRPSAFQILEQLSWKDHFASAATSSQNQIVPLKEVRQILSTHLESIWKKY